MTLSSPETERIRLATLSDFFKRPTDVAKIPNASLLLILLTYVLLAILYAVLTPPWESPDEPAHYAYVKDFAERWRPPLKPISVQTDRFFRDYEYLISNSEWFQPSLGYLPSSAVYRILEAVTPNLLPTEVPPLNPLFGTNPTLYPNLFQHPTTGLWQTWNSNWGLLLIRIVSSLLGLVVIFVAYRIASLLEGAGRELALVSAAWVAFLPQFTFITATVRSDSVTNAIAAVVILCAVLLQTKSANRNRTVLIMGVLTGIGLLTKLTFVYIAPIGLIAITLTSIRCRRSWLRLIVYFLTPVVVLTGGYHALFGEARSALAYVLTTVALRPDALSLDYLMGLPVPLWVDLFYACFGWANVLVAAPWRWLAFGIWGIGACVTVVQSMRVLREPADRQRLRIIAVLVTGLLLVFLGTIRLNLSVFTPQGRYIFPALAAWSVVTFWGLWQILPPNGREILGLAAPYFMLAFNMYSLLFVLIPTYYLEPS